MSDFEVNVCCLWQEVLLSFSASDVSVTWQMTLLVIVNNEVIFQVTETSRRGILSFDFLPKTFVSPRISQTTSNHQDMGSHNE